MNTISTDSSSEDIKDIAGLIHLDNAVDYLFLSIVFLVFVAFIYLVYKYLKTKKINITKVAEISCEVRARLELKELYKLKQEKLSRSFAEGVSEVLRVYITERFHEPIKRETTQEFFARVCSLEEKKSIMELDDLKFILGLSDKAKFSLGTLSFKELDDLLSKAESYIDKTSTINKEI